MLDADPPKGLENLKARVAEKKSYVVGMKQAVKAIKAGSAETVYVAEDADPALKTELAEVCGRNGINPVAVSSMEEIGKACGIDVGSAVAVLLKTAI